MGAGIMSMADGFWSVVTGLPTWVKVIVVIWFLINYTLVICLKHKEKKWKFKTFRLKEKAKTKRVVAKVKAQKKACQKKRKSSGVTKKVRSKESEHGN